MVPINGIRQMVMIGVHGTGRLTYKCFNVFSFFIQKVVLLVKNDKHSLYRESKLRRFGFFILQLPLNVTLTNCDEYFSV